MSSKKDIDPRTGLKDTFKPLPPVIARPLAHQVFLVYQERPDWLPKQRRHCKLCQHPRREEIDYLLLTGANTTKLRQTVEAKMGEWARRKFLHHRDLHLMPLIEMHVRPMSLMAKEYPYPMDGDTHAKGLFYLMQHYAIYHEAVQKGELDTATRSLKEMRTVDVEMLGAAIIPKDRRMMLSPPEEEPEPLEMESIAGMSEHEERLQRAFQRSNYRKEQNGTAKEQSGDTENAIGPETG